VTNSKRKFTEERCTTDPYDPWRDSGDPPGEVTDVPIASLDIGNFPDNLPRLSEIRQ
jgi:hypothetical protein